MAQESNWRRGRPEQNLAVGEPQTESQGADVRPGFDTLITMDLQKKGRALLGTLPGDWCPLPSEKRPEASVQLCRSAVIWPCVSSCISFMVLPFMLHLSQMSFPPRLWKSYLAFEIQTTPQCLRLSRHNLLLPSSSYSLGLQLDLSGHFMLPRISVWLVTRFSPVDCDFLEDGHAVTLSILMVPHTPVRPSFPGHPVANRIHTTLPTLHPDLFSP